MNEPVNNQAGIDRPLRVLHLVTVSDLGGVSRYLFDVCTALRARGHETTIAGQRGQWHSLFQQSDLPWVQLPIDGGVLNRRRSAAALTQRLREQPVDLIHAHYRRASLVGRAVARRVGVPLIYTLHLPGFPVRGLWRWVSDFGDYTHAVSRGARQWLVDHAGVGPQQVTVIPHGVDAQRYPLADEPARQAARRALGVSESATVVAFAGRFAIQKHPHWMLDLAAASRQAVADLVILMIGQGPDEAALHRRIAAEGLGDRVRLLPYGDPMQVYHACDALLLPSRNEGFALVCAEAMSVGRPVLRTDTGGASEQIIEAVTGRTVSVDRDAFIDAAIAFLSDRQALATMGAAAAEHVRKHLRFDEQIRHTIDFYRACIEPGQPRRRRAPKPAAPPGPDSSP